MKDYIYLDYAATTPINAEVLSYMNEIYRMQLGNASSIHQKGQKASVYIEESRSNLANYLGCQPSQLMFCSSATEANNLALQNIGINSKEKCNVLYQEEDHPSIVNCLKEMERQSKIHLVPYPRDARGVIDTHALLKLLQQESIHHASLTWVNSETGILQPITEIIELLNPYNIPVHVDAVQGILCHSIKDVLPKKGTLSLSSHKIYGPLGAAVLYSSNELSSIMQGGGQEFGIRPGTENIPAIAGFSKAIELCTPEAVNIAQKVADFLEIPFYIMNERDFFYENIVKKFINTPICLSSETLPSLDSAEITLFVQTRDRDSWTANKSSGETPLLFSFGFLHFSKNAVFFFLITGNFPFSRGIVSSLLYGRITIPSHILFSLFNILESNSVSIDSNSFKVPLSMIGTVSKFMRFRILRRVSYSRKALWFPSSVSHAMSKILKFFVSEY